MKLVTPNYSKRTPIVSDNNFVDGNPPIGTPTIGAPMATFNPGAKSGLPTPPRFVTAPGKRVQGIKGLTNKRQTSNL